MTESSASNLSGSKVQQLLSALGSAPVVAESVPEATGYDWRDPHYFNEDQSNRLAALMTQVAALLSERFEHFYKSQFDVKVASITQHYAEGLSEQTKSDQGFSLPFGSEPSRPCGFLSVTVQTGLGWATRLLGDSEAGDDADRAISSLEESLLTDLLGAVVQAFLSPLDDSQNLRPANELIKGAPIMPYEPTMELCRLVFQITECDADPGVEMQLVLLSSTLAPLVGKAPASQANQPQEQLTRLLTEHVHNVPVTVTARLANTRICFEEVLDLTTDDILLIGKPIEEPVDLMIGDRIVFRGSAAQSEAHYAVFVTECAADPAGHAAETPAAN
jgi:flagellar motor switch protein FliM